MVSGAVSGVVSSGKRAGKRWYAVPHTEIFRTKNSHDFLRNSFAHVESISQVALR